MKVPVENVFHMASYALDAVQWLGVGNHSHTPEAPAVADALVLLLLNEVDLLVRRGLERGYVEEEAVLRSPRGKILVTPTIARLLHKRPELHCRFEELTIDIPVNRLIAGVLWRTATDHEVDAKLRQRAARMADTLEGVTPLDLEPARFRRPELGRKNRHYRPVLDLCELLVRAWFPDEDDADEEWQVRGIDRQDRLMAHLFERFVCSYLARQPGLRVRPRQLAWEGGGLDAPSQAALPAMRTDATVVGDGWTAVVEVKFYRDPLVERYGKKTLRSGHLYQLLAYLRRHAAERPLDWPTRGVLVYAHAGTSFDFRYQLDGYDIRAVTVDLTAPWAVLTGAVLDALA